MTLQKLTNRSVDMYLEDEKEFRRKNRNKSDNSLRVEVIFNFK